MGVTADIAVDCPFFGFDSPNKVQQVTRTAILFCLHVPCSTNILRLIVSQLWSALYQLCNTAKATAQLDVQAKSNPVPVYGEDVGNG